MNIAGGGTLMHACASAAAEPGRSAACSVVYTIILLSLKCCCMEQEQIVTYVYIIASYGTMYVLQDRQLLSNAHHFGKLYINSFTIHTVRCSFKHSLMDSPWQCKLECSVAWLICCCMYTARDSLHTRGRPYTSTLYIYAWCCPRSACTTCLLP